MVYKYFRWVLCFLFLPHLLLAQSYKITGKVINGNTCQAIPMVACWSDNGCVLTDNQGNFEINSPKPIHRIIFKKTNFITWILPITVKEDPKSQDVLLWPQSTGDTDQIWLFSLLTRRFFCVPVN